MATRPELHIAVAKTKSKASEYNENFTMMMDYCEAVSTEAKDYVDTTLEGNVFYRILGETIFSLIPLTDSSVHLLDGSIINGSGIYKDFVDEIVALAEDYPQCFCTEAQWQQSISDYGVCGKFVNNTTSVRLPKVTGIVEGTVDVSALGSLVEAGLPNITGQINDSYSWPGIGSASGAFSFGSTSSNILRAGDGGTIAADNHYTFDASGSNSIYGNSSTVQPQTIKGYYYIVVATATKTDIEVDIDEIATDLNGKADVDLSNISASQTAINTIVGWGMPDYDAGIIIGNGNYTPAVNGLMCAWMSVDANQIAGVKIIETNVDIMYMASSSSWEGSKFGAVPLCKGITYNVYGFNTVKFFPLKGAN